MHPALGVSLPGSLSKLNVGTCSCAILGLPRLRNVLCLPSLQVLLKTVIIRREKLASRGPPAPRPLPVPPPNCLGHALPLGAVALPPASGQGKTGQPPAPSSSRPPPPSLTLTDGDDARHQPAPEFQPLPPGSAGSEPMATSRLTHAPPSAALPEAAPPSFERSIRAAAAGGGLLPQEPRPLPPPLFLIGEMNRSFTGTATPTPGS